LGGVDESPSQQPKSVLRIASRVSVADRNFAGFLKTPCRQQGLQSNRGPYTRFKTANSLDGVEIANYCVRLSQLQR
jgi:hypothetical protein